MLTRRKPKIAGNERRSLPGHGAIGGFRMSYRAVSPAAAAPRRAICEREWYRKIAPPAFCAPSCRNASTKRWGILGLSSRAFTDVLSRYLARVPALLPWFFASIVPFFGSLLLRAAKECEPLVERIPTSLITQSHAVFTILNHHRRLHTWSNSA